MTDLIRRSDALDVINAPPAVARTFTKADVEAVVTAIVKSPAFLPQSMPLEKRAELLTIAALSALGQVEG